MKKWWHDRVVYQIYPRSFQDTNGDGIGDIPGILMHLDKLKDLGIGIIWLSPVYCSPDSDNGYDISDYKNIHPQFGTMQDMESLLAEAEKRDIKIVMDLVINHTSDEHPWFQASRDKDSPYRDYYFWRPGKNGKLPNNWTSFFAENCWEYDAKSGEYYLHLFSKKQPDLNYQNPKVLEEIKTIMRFWLDKGVSGFRCDVINLIHKSSLEDGKKRLILTGQEHYLSQDGMHTLLHELRQDVLNHYDCFTVGETVFVTPKVAKALCDESREELNMLFSFEHMETDQIIVKWFRRKFNAKRFAQAIVKWQDILEWNANYLENHDQQRCVSRFGDDTKYWAESAKMLCTLLLSLRGTPYIYQGQEIGMCNFDYNTMHDIQDIESHNVYRLAKRLHFPKWLRWRIMKTSSRDNARTPMQWSNRPNAGFTTGTPWLAVNKNYTQINLDSQIKDPQSIWQYYKSIIAFRGNSDALKFGSFSPLKLSKYLFVYKRQYKDQSLIIVLSFSKKSQRYACKGRLLVSSYGRTSFDGKLKPYEAIIFQDNNDTQSNRGKA